MRAADTPSHASKHWYDRVTRLGLASLPQEEQLRGKVVNAIAQMALTLTMLYSLSLYAVQHLSVAFLLVNCLWAGGYAGYFLLVLNARHQLARIALFVWLMAQLFWCVTCLLGRHSGLQICYVAVAGFAFLSFDPRQRRVRNSLGALAMALYVLCELLPGGVDVLPELAHSGQFTRLVVVPLVMLMVFSILDAYTHEIAHRQAELDKMACTDVLTGMLNRRATLELGGMVLASSKRQGRHVSVLMLDVDHFKKVNDIHGHAAGDQVLVAVASALRAHVRGSDAMGRWGGEEFVVIAAHDGVEGGMTVAEKLREEVANLLIPRRDGVALRCTVSVGVATQCAADETLEALMGSADKALYLAKAQGRNMCVRAA